MKHSSPSSSDPSVSQPESVITIWRCSRVRPGKRSSHADSRLYCLWPVTRESDQTRSAPPPTCGTRNDRSPVVHHSGRSWGRRRHPRCHRCCWVPHCHSCRHLKRYWFRQPAEDPLQRNRCSQSCMCNRRHSRSNTELRPTSTWRIPLGARPGTTDNPIRSKRVARSHRAKIRHPRMDGAIQSRRDPNRTRGPRGRTRAPRARESRRRVHESRRRVRESRRRVRGSQRRVRRSHLEILHYHRQRSHECP
jgi:hypothetical protein